MIQHHEPVGDAHHRVHRVLDDDHGHALPAQAHQHIQHIVAFVAAQPRQRFVQQQQSRRAGQRPRKFHQPKLLVGQSLGGNPGLISQPDTLQRLRGRGDRGGISEAGAVGSNDDIVQQR